MYHSTELECENTHSYCSSMGMAWHPLNVLSNAQF